MSRESFTQDILLRQAVQLLAVQLQESTDAILRRVLLTDTYKQLMNINTRLYLESAECIAFLLIAEFDGNEEALAEYWEAE